MARGPIALRSPNGASKAWSPHCRKFLRCGFACSWAPTRAEPWSFSKFLKLFVSSTPRCVGNFYDLETGPTLL
jgi:hypothetical protein